MLRKGSAHPRAPRAGAWRQSGLTLLELLVAITILCVLAALLSPALAHALETARASSCRGNLRQVALALLLYVEENRGWHLSARAPHPEDTSTFVGPSNPEDLPCSDYGSWANWVCVYQFDRQDSFLECPALPAGRGINYDAPDRGDRFSFHTSYIMNAIGHRVGDAQRYRWGREDNNLEGRFGDDTALADRTYGWTGAVYSNYPQAARAPLHSARVRRTSEVIWVTEIHRNFGLLSDANRANAGTAVDRWTQTDHGPVLDSTAYSHYRHVGEHHAGGFNAVLGDGAVKHFVETSVEDWAAFTAR